MQKKCTCPSKKPLASDTYEVFDAVASAELVKAKTVNAIINSSMCIELSRAYLFGNDAPAMDVTVNDILEGLQNMVGVYHLWLPEGDYCSMHQTQAMQCIYVGKGEANKRAKKHLKQKYGEASDSANFFMTFHPCENRLALYLEQLFLDTYAMLLNKNGNTGTHTLYAYWGMERFQVGTEAHNVADAAAMRLFKAGKEPTSC